MRPTNGAEPTLEAKNLKTHFFTDTGVSIQLMNGRRGAVDDALCIAGR